MVRQAASDPGRDPSEVKFVAAFTPMVAGSPKEALDRRRTMDETAAIAHRAAPLSGLLGLPFTLDQLDEPLTPQQLGVARRAAGNGLTARALELAAQGWSLRDIAAHGVEDYIPTAIGTPHDVADEIERWHKAGAADGLILSFDAFHDALEPFVDKVVPLLQERGVMHNDYEGETLREHLHALPQYGRDPRFIH